MECLIFDKNQLVNLDQSLNAELIRSNQAGCYFSTTISGCNTRKYHGLLIAPAPSKGNAKHVLLSSLDETVIQRGAAFNLGLHKYNGEHFKPNGHKYLRSMEISETTTSTFRVGGVILTRERLFPKNSEQILMKYTLVEAHSDTTLRFRPFLAFRNIHELSRQNDHANTHFTPVDNGVMYKLYENTPELYMQFSKKVSFVPETNWYNNIEYSKEKDRGFDYLEDLLVPGYFELPIKKGESVIFSASTQKIDAKGLNIKWKKEKSYNAKNDNYQDFLHYNAMHFLQRHGNQLDIIAGYPWYGTLSRHAFIAAPGLISAKDDHEDYEAFLNTQVGRLKNGLFPVDASVNNDNYANIDTPLWFIHALQHYSNVHTQKSNYLWSKYGASIKQILTAYQEGTDYDIHMQDDGLIASKYKDKPLHWMNSMVDNKACVERMECLVEVNALWYNALCFAIELATAANDNDFVQAHSELKDKVGEAFVHTFWSEEEKTLVDGATYLAKDWSVRPNMVIAVAMPYSPLNKEQQKEVMSMAKRVLLTPRGLRTLSPNQHEYRGFVPGNATAERELIIHRGAAWPWLVQFFVKGYLKVHGRSGLTFVKRTVGEFESSLPEHGIGTFSEMYNGNPPHLPKGAVSFASSVASILRAEELISAYEEENI
ncbi:MAG: glycogen debranching enzyme N-terminal domain-containing protein [Mangrovibacterium sp.]